MAALFAEPRPEYISAAVDSYISLSRVVNDLSEAEVDKALELEAGSRRRQALIRRLIRRKTRLVEMRTRQELETKYMHDPSEVMKADVPAVATDTAAAEVKKPKSKAKKAKGKKAKKAKRKK